MNEIKFDEFFKDNFDTTGIEDDIYNQIAKDIARCIDIDLAKTPLVDILTGYTRYKIQELEIERLHSIIKEVRELIKSKWEKDSYWEDVDDCLKYCRFSEFEKEELLEILDKENK